MVKLLFFLTNTEQLDRSLQALKYDLQTQTLKNNGVICLEHFSALSAKGERVKTMGSPQGKKTNKLVRKHIVLNNNLRSNIISTLKLKLFVNPLDANDPHHSSAPKLS